MLAVLFLMKIEILAQKCRLVLTLLKIFFLFSLLYQQRHDVNDIMRFRVKILIGKSKVNLDLSCFFTMVNGTMQSAAVLSRSLRLSHRRSRSNHCLHNFMSQQQPPSPPSRCVLRLLLAIVKQDSTRQNHRTNAAQRVVVFTVVTACSSILQDLHCLFYCCKTTRLS